MPAAVCFEREEVQQHLKPHAVPDIGHGKLLAPGLIVDDTEVKLAVMVPAVDTVGNAGEDEAVLSAAELDRRHFARVGKIKLKVQRLEVRSPQLRRHILDDAPDIPAQAVEEVDKAAALLVKIVELLGDILRGEAFAQLAQGLIVHRGKAAAALDLARGLFKDIVHEGADLRRAEGGWLIWLCAQAVLAEIRKAAGGKFIYARGAQAQMLTVELFDSRGREPPAAHVRRNFKRRIARRVLFGKVFSCRAGTAVTTVHGLRGKAERRGGRGHARVAQ